MSGEEIDNLEAGPELDALIAEKVMGWRREQKPPSSMIAAYFVDAKGRGRPILAAQPGVVMPFDWFNPSREIAAAWEVVEQFRAAYPPDHPGSVEVCVDRDGARAEIYELGVRIVQSQLDAWMREGRPLAQSHTSFAPTAPLAICRSALKAAAGEAGNG